MPSEPKCKCCGGRGFYVIAAGDAEWSEPCENCDAAKQPKPRTIPVPEERLRELEWAGHGEWGSYYPACGALKIGPHEKGCWLSALLREGGK